MHSILDRIDHLKSLVRSTANTDLAEVRHRLDELRDHVETLIGEARQEQPEQAAAPAVTEAAGDTLPVQAVDAPAADAAPQSAPEPAEPASE